MDREKLYTEGPSADAKAPVLIAHFDGAMDAGSSGSLSIIQLLNNLSPRRVATFDSDQLLDYRAHRPVMVVEDWVTKEVVAPEIALDLVHDDTGTPILILHGPEPDAKWEAFTQDVAELARAAGVEIVVSLYGFPAAVPHTRPVSVHVQSTDKDLIPEQGSLMGNWQLPAPLTHFMQYRLSAQDLHGMTLYAAVPYYMSDSAFPKGASALLRRLSSVTELSLPVGDLEEGADADAEQVEKLVSQNPEVMRTVEALETHYDQMASNPDSPLTVAFPNFLGNGEESKEEASAKPAEKDSDQESVAETLGDAIEQYLRAQSFSESTGEDDDGPPSGGPKHRAPRPWEQD